MKLNINDVVALAIKNNTKRVEVRVGKESNEYDFSKLNKNDIIEFNSNNLGIFYVKVKEVNCYDSLDELFILEGTRYVTLSINDEENLTKLRKNCVYAIHIEYLYSENTVWEELYEKAKNVRNKKDISGMISSGGVVQLYQLKIIIFILVFVLILHQHLGCVLREMQLLI